MMLSKIRLDNILFDLSVTLYRKLTNFNFNTRYYLLSHVVLFIYLLKDVALKNKLSQLNVTYSVSSAR